MLAEFPRFGHLEGAVHNLLPESRNTDGRGREWFRVPLPEAVHAVACLMAGSINSANAVACGAAAASFTSEGSGSATALTGRSAAMDSDSA